MRIARCVVELGERARRGYYPPRFDDRAIRLAFKFDLRPNVLRVLALFRHSGSTSVKKSLVLCVAIGVGLSAPAAFARGGGMGSHHSASASAVGSGGAFGERVGAPGTNSLGTALSSSGFGSGPQKGPLLGTNPAIDREEAKVNKMISSICRGC